MATRLVSALQVESWWYGYHKSGRRWPKTPKTPRGRNSRSNVLKQSKSGVHRYRVLRVCEAGRRMRLNPKNKIEYR
jgi:hypothetical protein